MSYVPALESMIDRYAQIIAERGLGVRKRGVTLIVVQSPDPIGVDVAHRVANACYRLGAAYVYIHIETPEAYALQMANATDAFKSYVPKHCAAVYEEMVEAGGSILHLLDESRQGLYDSLPGAVVQEFARSTKRSEKSYLDAKNAKLITYTKCRVPSLRWAKRESPDLAEEEAVARLWTAILQFSGADREDWRAWWDAHASHAREMQSTLNRHMITSLYIRNARTDLTVSLADGAQWMISHGTLPDGRAYLGNLPSFELFTAPHRLRAEGTIATSRPTVLQGVVIDEIELTFKEGKVMAHKASNADDLLAAYLATEGADRMGEIALVSNDTPIAESEYVPKALLFLENAGSHFALGYGAAGWIKDGTTLSSDERIARGLNDMAVCSVHQDFIFGEAETDVVAVTGKGEQIELMKSGLFVSETK